VGWVVILDWFNPAHKIIPNKEKFSMTEAFLSIKNITKRYPGVIALNNFSMEFKFGEVHALLGENGAGKSTLIKIISGAIHPDEGWVILGGEKLEKISPHLSQKLGIHVIYQEFSLVESLSFAQNIFLGKYDGLITDHKALIKKSGKIFENMEVDLDPSMRVRELSPAKKQLVEIAKAISTKAKILIMDEPSAPLSASEVETMFSIIRKLRDSGVTVIYISHRIEELFQISDRVTVMRDGCYVKTLKTKNTSRNELISLMVGRKLQEYYPPRDTISDEVILEVINFSGLGDTGISFNLKKGEILGIAGLVGSGRTELVNLIYGAAKKDTGSLKFMGKPIRIDSPRDSLSYGIGLIPEDRKQQGCILRAAVDFNITLSVFNQLSKLSLLNKKQLELIADHYREILNIRTPSLKQKVQFLSGGNQQKVVMAKTLAAKTRVLIFDEPTRGIDVGAKQDIYQIMVDFVREGNAIIMVSSEMEELLGMSDRLIVLFEGKMMGEIPRSKFDQHLVIDLASGRETRH
jgi:ribose transport system ATP-binding protein